MRLIMMGTGGFAVPTFRALLESRHDVLALVTRPARPVHGRRKEPHNPMLEEARQQGAHVLQPETANCDEARSELASLQADLLVVCDYGEILKPATLAVAKQGGINLHASLLPKYRGAAPINWAIYHGEEETGVTVIHMTPGLDAGPCIAQSRMEIGPDETAPEVETRLAARGAELVCAVVDRLEAGQAQPVEQDTQQATRAPRLKKSDGQVAWSRTAEQIKNQVRAFKPWPQTYTFLNREGREPLRLILHRVAVQMGDAPVPAGTVLRADDELLVATGEDLLRILEIQPAGKRVMSAEEFLRGHAIEPGERFG